ncbi:TPA: IS3 family transposase, partial [Escherichia coli]
CLLCEAHVVRYRFIRDNVKVFSIRTLCRVMKVCVSAYYDRARKPEESSDDDVKLRVQIRALFAALRGGAGRWSKNSVKKACQ